MIYVNKTAKYILQNRSFKQAIIEVNIKKLYNTPYAYKNA